MHLLLAHSYCCTLCILHKLIIEKKKKKKKIDHANLVDKQFDDTKSSRSDVFGVYQVVFLSRGAVIALVRARRRMSMVHHKRHRGVVWFPDPSCMGGAREGRKGLVNNSTLMRMHGCIPAFSVDEGKRKCQVGVSRE